MRLLNTVSFQLQEFVPKKVPEYAILSHTWGKGEVLYQDILNGEATSKLGWSKVKQCCHRAREDGFDYVWIDTLCIDKTNSVELSMAINSMFLWYEQAAVCYAYLSDVDTTAYSIQRQLERARWFTRGWCLQELLAPKFLIFVGQAWEEFGTRSSLSHLLEPITKIKATHLADFKHCTIATKMSWDASRTTTLVEDEAYCLLGLFGIHLSPIYGEGKNALVRLQQELLRTYNDESVLAWNAYASTGRLLAASPAAFHQELVLLKFDAERPESFLTNKGLIISPLLYQRRGEDGALLDTFLMPLNCGLPDESAAVALTLKAVGDDTFQRVDCERTSLFPMQVDWQPTTWQLLGRRRICIEQKTELAWLSLDARLYLIRFQHPVEIRTHYINSIGASHKLQRADPQSEHSSIKNALERYWDDEFVQMPFGRFIAAKFEVNTGDESSSYMFGVAIRRCDNTLTLRCWNDIATFEEAILSYRDAKPPASTRTDFAQISQANKPTVQVRLRPRGWPPNRPKLSAGAKAFTVSITLPPPGSDAVRNRQESKTWQRLTEAVDELSAEFTEL